MARNSLQNLRSNPLGEGESESFLRKLRLDVNNLEHDRHQTHLASLAKTPFFLILLLAHYKKDSWKSIPNRWSLFPSVVRILWEENKRVKDFFNRQDPVIRQYYEAARITEVLADLAYRCLKTGQTSIPDHELDRPPLRDLSKILLEAGILTYGRWHGGFRFSHNLFMEYFAAVWLRYESDFLTYAKLPSWSGVLVMLADSSSEKRSEIQQAVLRAMAEDKSASGTSDRGANWAIGEIGDIHAIPQLIGIYRNSGNGDLLSAIGRIAGRSPDGASQKEMAINVIAEVLLDDLPTSDFDALMSSHTLDPIFRMWRAAEAMSEIGNSVAAKHLLSALAKHSEKLTFPLGGHIRRNFTGYLFHVGNAAVPALINSLDSNDFTLSLVASEALFS